MTRQLSQRERRVVKVKVFLTWIKGKQKKTVKRYGHQHPEGKKQTEIVLFVSCQTMNNKKPIGESIHKFLHWLGLILLIPPFIVVIIMNEFKLSNVKSRQYLDGWPLEHTRFCKLVDMRVVWLTDISHWNIGSHTITEVKQCNAWSVPRWVTTRWSNDIKSPHYDTNTLSTLAEFIYALICFCNPSPSALIIMSMTVVINILILYRPVRLLSVIRKLFEALISKEGC